MKQFFSIPLLLSLLFICSQSVIAEPSRVFFQETADIEAEGSLSLDFEAPFSSNGRATGLRIGAFDGVILINSHSELGMGMGFKSSNMGFKKKINKDVSAYGIISHTDDGTTSDTELALGFAYTVKSGTLTYNINPELITDTAMVRGNKTTIYIKGAVMMPLTSVKVGKATAIVEVNLENNSVLDTILNLGLRWAPRKDITLDFIVYSDNDTGTFKGLPGWIKVNIQF